MYKFILLILPLFYYNVLTLISLFVFSLGFYSDEIDKFGYFNGSVTFFIVFLTISLFSYYLVWTMLPSQFKKLDFKLRYKNEIFYISLFLIIFYAVPVILYKPAFVLGINRYEFIDLNYVKFFNIKLFLAILSFLWGAYASQEKKISRYTCLWISFILISFCYGEKSSGVIDSLIYFSSGYFLYKNVFISLKKFVLLFLLIISFPFILFTLQLIILDIPLSELVASFLSRLARQGQVFWIAYEDIVNNNVSIVNSDIFNYYNNSEKGMKLIMESFMPVEKLINHNGSLSAGYPAILFLSDNNIIVILFYYFIFSIVSIFPFIIYFFMLLRYKFHYIITFIIVFSITVHLKIFQSGNIQLITNLKYIVFYAAVIFLFFYAVNYKRIKNDL